MEAGAPASRDIGEHGLPHKPEYESAEAKRIVEAYERRDVKYGARKTNKYSMFNRGALLKIQEVHFEILQALRRFHYDDLTKLKLLEVGCGRGYYVRQFVQWGMPPENICGVDLLPDRIEAARKLCPPAVTLLCGDASRLQFDDSSFDLVLEASAFTSIFDLAMAKSIAREMMRVLKPGGAILWYDFWASNPENPDVRGWKRGQIEELFPGMKIHLKRITLAPPIGALVGKASISLYRALSAIKALDTHYLGVFQKPQSTVAQPAD
jgi:ubiquinone/menaquinone biosynthesis C-methylase UbiE